MGLKPDQMAAMEEMEADNMDQNLGMENQDLSRGNIFFMFLIFLKYLKLVSASTKIWETTKKWTMKSILLWIMKVTDSKYGWEKSLKCYGIKIRKKYIIHQILYNKTYARIKWRFYLIFL